MLGTILALAACLWIFRDLPRRRVERALTGKLGAEIRLGSLSMLGPRRFLLRDLEIRHMAGQPRLERLHIDTLLATGSALKMIDGHFETLHLSDVEARLVPPAQGQHLEPAAEPVHFEVGHLDVERGRIEIAAGEGTVDLNADAKLTGVGGDLAGDILFRSERIRLEPLLRFALGGKVESTGHEARENQDSIGTEVADRAGAPEAGLGAVIEGFEARVTFAGRDGKTAIEASGRRLTLLNGGRTLTIPDPSIEATIVQDDRERTIKIEARPKLSIVESASLSARVDPSTVELMDAEAHLRGVALAPVLVLLAPLPDGMKLEANADLDVEGRGRNLLDYRINVSVPRVEIERKDASPPTENATMLLALGSSLEAGGTIRLDEASRGASCRATVEVPAISGSVRGVPIPAALFPLHATLEADITAVERLRAEGRAVLETASAGRIEADGTASSSPEGPTIDLRWIWRDVELDRIVFLARSIGLASAANLALHGKVEAAGTLKGPLFSPALEGTLEARSLEVSPSEGRAIDASPLDGRTGSSRSFASESATAPRRSDGSGPSFGNGDLTARIAWRGGRSPIEVAALHLRGDASFPPLATVPITVAAAGRIDPDAGRAVLDRATLASQGLFSMTAHGWADLRTPRASTAEETAGDGEGALTTGRTKVDSQRGSTAEETVGHGEEALTTGRTKVDERSAAPVGETSGDREKALTTGRTKVDGERASTTAGGAVSRDEARASAKIHLESVDLSRWRGFLLPLTGDPAPGYAIKGTAEADLDCTLRSSGEWTASGAAKVSKTGFASEDGARVLEGLDTVWDLKLEGARDGTAVVIEAKAAVGGFQLLWGSFFADGTGLTSSVDLTARASSTAGLLGTSPIPDTSTATARDPSPVPDASPAHTQRPAAWSWTGRAVWDLPAGPRVDASLALAPSAPLSYSLDLDVEDLGRTVERCLRATLGDSVPFFSRIEAGGTLRATAHGTLSNERRTIRGEVRARDVRLAGTNGFAELQGLDLDLPFDVQWGTPGADGVRAISGEELRGNLRLSSLAAGGLTIGPLETGLRVRADSVRLEEGLASPLFGGAVGLEAPELADLLRPSRRLVTGILLSKLSVRDVTQAFDLLPLEGELNGYFPHVRLSTDSLQVEGGGELSVFGGRLRVAEISGEQILSRYPKLTFSADFQDIDLEKLTRAFDFGRMTGVVQGSARDCELFRGVPVRFEGLLETVERAGVPRTINVKAIKNITILGTGGGINIFDRGIQKLFDNYTYERLGIRMSLRNDAFVLRGLIQERGRELFLKGRLPFPINVINAQPGTTVSFRTMIERLMSLDFSKATRER